MSGALDVLDDNDKKLMAEMEAADALPQEPEPEPAPAPAAPDAAPDAAPAEPATPSKTVPQEALHAERERRKGLEAKLRETETANAAKLARVEERLALLIQAASAQPQAPAAPPPAPVAPPDPQVDPLGYVQHVTRDLNGQIATLNERVQKTEGVEQQIATAQLQQARQQELQSWSWGQEAEFATDTPDYGNAMQHLRDARIRQLAVMGHTNPAVVQQLLAQDVSAMAQQARQGGMQFGKMLYDMAVASGYQRGAQTAPQAPAAVQATPPPATPGGLPTPAQRAATAQRGADMAAGLGTAGSAPRGELTPTALAEMSEAEFATVLAKMAPAGMRQLFGD